MTTGGQIVELTPEDLFAAANVATTQIMRKLYACRRSDHGGQSKRSMRERFGDGIVGCLGEIAVSKGLNLAWTPGGMRISRGDVGGTIEVRATEYATGHLTVYRDPEKDSDGSVFALVVGVFPRFRIAGYIRGGEAKQQQWWRDSADPPCYFVPQAALHATIEQAL